MTDTAAAVAAFLARKAITKVPTGASSGISNRAFFLASRGDISLKREDAFAADENRYERAMEAARETRHVGGTESDALDAYNATR